MSTMVSARVNLGHNAPRQKRGRPTSTHKQREGVQISLIAPITLGLIATAIATFLVISNAFATYIALGIVFISAIVKMAEIHGKFAASAVVLGTSMAIIAIAINGAMSTM